MKLKIQLTLIMMLGILMSLIGAKYATDKVNAAVPPPKVLDAILGDIDTICKGYEYKESDPWYGNQQIAWEHQGFYNIPTYQQLNNFCKDKGM